MTDDTRGVYGIRFRLVYLALALVAAGSGAALWTEAFATRTLRCSGAPSMDPVATAVAFLQDAVERRDTARSWGLVTDALRGTRTCSQWARRLPIEPYRDIDWNRASYRLEAGGDRQIVYAVQLYSRRRAAARRFLLELREVGNVWLVGTWTRATV